MTARRVMDAAGGDALASNESALIAAEFLQNQPLRFLLFRTVIALACFALAGAADWLAVFHLMTLKFTDAMGNPIGDTAGLIAMSGVTLIGYVLIGYAYGRPERWAKLIALCLYAVVLALLALAIAPVETPNLREVWASLSGGGGFGSANAADAAPPWFLLPCIAVLAVAFSLFGVVFLVAKAWFWAELDLWRYRFRAMATLQRLDAEQERFFEANRHGDGIALLENTAFTDSILQSVAHAGIEAYKASIETQIAALQTALADVRHSKAEKQGIRVRLDAAQSCLASVHAL